ncbi:MAG: hypothetical protein KF851_08880 [Pirellulaceae bacterium]|nr:hypothetical protein [Pirellulaceae bacterium]
MKRVVMLAVCLGFCTLANAGFAQNHTRDGTIGGGAAGAVIGGIVGKQSGKTTEGALIGGVVGAITGNIAGSSKDQQIARERYYQNQLVQQQQRINQLSSRVVTTDDVISMTRNGLSDNVIINYIQTNGVNRQLSVSEIISLHQMGVSENVISAMQRAPVGNPAMSQPTPVHVQSAPSTVIVREHYPAYAPPVIYHTPPPPTFYYYRSGYRHW